MRIRLGLARKEKGRPRPPLSWQCSTGGTGADVPRSVAEVVTSFTHKPALTRVYASSLSCRSEWRDTGSRAVRRPHLVSELHGRQTAPHPKMQGRCTDGGRVSRGVAHGCDLSLPAVALGRCASMTEAQWSARGRNMKLPSLAPAGLARVCQFFVESKHGP
jgi:hypothetical protein